MKPQKRSPKLAAALKLLEERVAPCHQAYLLDMLKARLAGEAASADEVKYREFPVDIRTFIEGPKYLNKKNVIYPKVMIELEAMNDGTYVESVLTGGIGSGKSTAALYTTAYQLYLLSCYKSPHDAFNLDPSSEIIFIFQSITAKLAKDVDYARFRDMIAEAPYFRREYPFDEALLSKMVFPNRVEVVPVSGAETAAIGQNVIGGIIDELNYMSVVEKSSLSVDSGTYDQAIQIYNSISRRRKSRFMELGKLPGILCLVSSRRYPGQFTDTKEAEAKTDPTIYVYDKRSWDIRPEGAYTGKTFFMFLGDQFRRPRIMAEGEKVAQKDRDLVMAIPMEYKGDFDRDILSALREIAGVSTLALHPFITNTDAIGKCIRKGLTNMTLTDIADFQDVKVKLRSSAMKDASEFFRWVHVDLGITSDSAGIVMGHVAKFVRVRRGLTEIETLPLIQIDLILEIQPPRNGEVNFAKIRELIYLMSKMGVPIRWVTYDSYQSRDSLQILRSKGYTTGLLSMDATPIPYDVLKTGVYDTRVRMPYHPKVIHELSTLERDPKTGKVDHPPSSSKDIADALAGVVYGLSTRRETYRQHSVSPDSIPQWLVQASGQASMGIGETTSSPNDLTTD